jgi:zinc transport system substrate-binding protein
MIVMTRLLGWVLAALAVASVAGCGATGSWAASSGKLRVVVAFYPLEYAVQHIGGEHVEVAPLTKPGGEPHDVELTPRQVGRVATADLVVYEAGFQPAVDAAVRSEAHDHAFDVSIAARLDLAATGTESSGRDPHFWLDPLRYAAVGDAVAQRLAALDPAHRTAYESNARAFRGTLTTLDAEFRIGLAHCRHTELVTSHAAFGYLSRSYGLHQEGITGLDPEAEPDPATLARIADHVRASGATTVYAETLVSPEVVKTVARETGARMAVLDPIEGITDVSAGPDYPSVMRANLATLRTGQDCP